MVNVTNPLPDHGVECGQSHYGVFGGIVISAFENIAKRCTRRLMCEVVVYCPEPSFDCPFKPWHPSWRKVHFNTQALACVLQSLTVEFTAIVKHELAHDAMRRPIILDFWNFFVKPNLWEEGMLETL